MPKHFEAKPYQQYTQADTKALIEFLKSYDTHKRTEAGGVVPGQNGIIGSQELARVFQDGRQRDEIVDEFSTLVHALNLKAEIVKGAYDPLKKARSETSYSREHATFVPQDEAHKQWLRDLFKNAGVTYETTLPYRVNGEVVYKDGKPETKHYTFLHALEDANCNYLNVPEFEPTALRYKTATSQLQNNNLLEAVAALSQAIANNPTVDGPAPAGTKGGVALSA